jgi:uncharacterized protein with HEPN domain
MREDDRVRIKHMIDAAESVEKFIAGRTRGDLDQDLMLQFAVLRAIEIMGEAAARTSDEAKSGTPHIPWRTIVAMRNRLIHGYFEIDTEVVWKTITQELPQILPLLRDL